MQNGWPCSFACVKEHHQPVAEIQPSLISFKLHSVTPLSSISICLQGALTKASQHSVPPKPALGPSCCLQAAARTLLAWGPAGALAGALLASCCASLLELLGLLYLRKMIQYLQLEPGAEGPTPLLCSGPAAPARGCVAGGFQRDRGQEKRKSLGN